MNKFIICIALSVLIIAGLNPVTALARNIDVKIITKDGYTLPMYSPYFPICTAIARYYIPAAKWQTYSIQITNDSSRKIGLVIAVDGKNIITGQKSALRNTERMYVLEPYSSGSYESWFSPRNYANRFAFTSESNTTIWQDRPAIGNIAVTAYFDKKYPSNSRKESSDTLSQAFIDPEKSYAQKFFIKYNWRTTLCKKGIINCSYPNGRFSDSQVYNEACSECSDKSETENELFNH